MDKKGFFVGIIPRSKGTFTKAMWASKDRTAATKDGSRERITFIALRGARPREGRTRRRRTEKKLQKSKTREMKVLETLHKKKTAEEAKAERQRAKEKREKAKKTRGEELAAPRTLKQQERDAATAQILAIHLTMASEKPHKALPKKTKATSCCGWWKSTWQLRVARKSSS
jgi:hypothetical protein